VTVALVLDGQRLLGIVRGALGRRAVRVARPLAVPVAGLVKAVYLELRGAPTAPTDRDASHPGLFARVRRLRRNRPAQPDPPEVQDQETPRV